MLKEKYKFKNSTHEIDAVYVPSQFVLKRDAFIRVGYDIYETREDAADATKQEIDQYEYKLHKGEPDFEEAQAAIFATIENLADARMKAKDKFKNSIVEPFIPVAE